MIKILICGIGNRIDPGEGKIVLFTVAIENETENAENAIWEIVECLVSDPHTQEIPCIMNEGEISVIHCDSLQSITPTYFNIGDVIIGTVGISDRSLWLMNDYGLDWHAHFQVEGCAVIDQPTLIVKGESYQAVAVYCSPQNEGPCEGVITISNFCGPYCVFVRCNGIVPSGTKGDVNNDGNINVLDVVRAIHLKLNNLAIQPEAWAADCNENMKIDIADILCIINVMLDRGTCPP